MEEGLNYKCPNCGNTMEKGYIGTPRKICWLEDKEQYLFNSENIASDVFFRWQNNKLTGLKCSQCRLIIFKY